MPLPRHLTRPPAPRGNYAPPPGGDSGRDPFSVVFAITGETTYKGEQAWTGHEVWKFGDGTTTEVVNGHVLTTSQPGLTLDDTEFDVDADPPQLALGRLGPGAGGRVWELVAYGSIAGAAGNCGFHVRKVDCVSFATGASSVAVWDTDAVGWRLPSPITTGDGPAVATLVQDDFNRYAVKLESENATWYLNPTGRCDRTGAAVFRGDYLPLSLQEDSGSGEVVPCDDETITLTLKCVACSMSCGDYGPFPASMCVVTPDTAANPDATPNPTMNCSFYYGIAFDPVTVVFGAAGAAWGTAGTDYPATVSAATLSNILGTTAFPEHDVPVRWFGKGTLTHSSGTYSYGVEIWFDDDCGPNITYYLPVVEFPGTPGVMYVKLVSFTLPFGTPTGFVELPPVGSFPIAVPAGSVLPYQVGTDNSGLDQSSCPHGIIYPVDYPTVARWAYGGAGTFDLGPATVYSGGCSDTGGGGTAGCCAGEGEPLEGPGLVTLQLTITDGPNAGVYTIGGSHDIGWTFVLPGGNVPVRCNVTGTWEASVNPIPTMSTSVSCDPFGVVFPGADFGSADDVTLVVA